MRVTIASGKGRWACRATRRATVAGAFLLAMGGLVSRAAAQSAARLTAALASGGKEYVLTLGPIELPAGASHHQVAQPRAQEVPVPGDGWLRGYAVELVDAAGRRVPQTVLHHLNLIMPDRRDLFAPIMLRIGAAGEETSPVQLPWLMGFRVKRGERILVTAMFDNERSRTTYRGVRLRVHMPFTPSRTWLPPLSVHPFYIDVMPPAGIHAYDLPPGKSQRSWDARPAVAARILGMGGHIHEHGTLLRFEDVTAHKVLWQARPRLTPGGQIAGMPTAKFWWRGGLPVVPNHVYRLTAFYDNPTGRTIPDGAMGTLGGILVPARGSVWPALDRAAPDYRKDVQVTYTGMSMDMPDMDMRREGMKMAPSSSPPAGAPGHAGHQH